MFFAFVFAAIVLAACEPINVHENENPVTPGDTTALVQWNGYSPENVVVDMYTGEVRFPVSNFTSQPPAKQSEYYFFWTTNSVTTSALAKTGTPQLSNFRLSADKRYFLFNLHLAGFTGSFEYQLGFFQNGGKLWPVVQGNHVKLPCQHMSGSWCYDDGINNILSTKYQNGVYLPGAPCGTLPGVDSIVTWNGYDPENVIVNQITGEVKFPISNFVERPPQYLSSYNYYWKNGSTIMTTTGRNGTPQLSPLKISADGKYFLFTLDLVNYYNPLEYQVGYGSSKLAVVQGNHVKYPCRHMAGVWCFDDGINNYLSTDRTSGGLYVPGAPCTTPTTDTTLLWNGYNPEAIIVDVNTGDVKWPIGNFRTQPPQYMYQYYYFWSNSTGNIVYTNASIGTAQIGPMRLSADRKYLLFKLNLTNWTGMLLYQIGYFTGITGSGQMWPVAQGLHVKYSAQHTQNGWCYDDGINNIMATKLVGGQYVPALP